MPFSLPVFSTICRPTKWQWIIWAVASAILLTTMWRYPDLDYHISQQLRQWDGGFRDKHDGSLWSWLYHSVPAFTALYLLLAITLASGLITKASQKAGMFLLTIMTIGPGLIVNAYFKHMWGRPRPWYMFNNPEQWSYIPPLSPAGECLSNCSFPSGDVAAFSCLFAIAFICKARMHYLMHLIALICVALLGFTRMHQGSHYLSDVLASIYITYGICLITALLFSRQN